MSVAAIGAKLAAVGQIPNLDRAVLGGSDQSLSVGRIGQGTQPALVRYQSIDGLRPQPADPPLEQHAIVIAQDQVLTIHGPISHRGGR